VRLGAVMARAVRSTVAGGARGGLGGPGPVTIEAEVAALCGGQAFRGGLGQVFGVGEGLVHGHADLGLGALQLGGGEGGGLESLQLLEQDFLGLLHIAILGQHGAEHHEAGLGGAEGNGKDLGGQLGFHQGLVEAARGRIGEDGGGQIQVAAAGVEAGGRVVADHEHGGAAHAGDCDRGLTVLDGLEG